MGNVTDLVRLDLPHFTGPVPGPRATAIPALKSRKRFPSTSSIHAPSARATTSAGVETPGTT